MSLPKIVTREQWLAVRKELLAKEKDLTRRREEWEEPKGRSESARSATPDFSS